MVPHTPDAETAYWYIQNVVKDRWINGEEIIKKKPRWVYHYARWIIGGRWKAAESYIKKDPQYAYYYAMFVIKGRWLEAEPYIKKNKCWHKDYVEYIKYIDEKHG